MGKILYIDTSGKYSSIILFDPLGVVAQRKSTALNMHAQTLNIHIEEILHETQTTWQDLEAIAVMNGPGSYTGLRIGLSSAKGFCYAHDIPLLLFNRFQLMQSNSATDTENGYIIFARENEFFFQVQHTQGQEIGLPTIVNSEEITRIQKENSLHLYADDELVIPLFDNVKLLQADPLCIKKLVYAGFAENNFANLMHSEPFYLKNVHINKINKL
ncbi:MAG: tRNA (adenosine(37)-N6)-threonylcarbamoyltransferase complex dimerization subunit type 1 TsaB [Bacteroidetes bacterium]|nr:tRNA (adenosine(37)-N6)-threonylcarbamoyltransferase complex dimerization subunit type 1 TsaB [Bacteroidota bacterium]MBP6315044.1 tRNA (adenosine(37)-N6)-threonylcarbamoyltransferase complex dimerization subunit type 1 TsaB [Chitinophagaceae bacterium]